MRTGNLETTPSESVPLNEQQQVPSKVGHIVCPFDYRAPSDRALTHAISLANALNVSLTMLYVYEEPSFASATDPPLETTTSRNDREAARRELELRAEQEAPRVSRGLHTQFLTIQDGTVADAIVKATDHFKHPLIVMDTHARSGIKRLLLGSVTEAVVRQTRVPVLAVPPGAA